MFDATSGNPFGYSWDLIPISRATNSYDLLEDLKKTILEEPLRLRMNDWVTALAGWTGILDIPLPECGTVACCSGWLALLRRSRAITQVDILGYHHGHDFPESALQAISALFYDMVDHLTPGTLAYAEHITQKITAIQKEHEGDLKAFSLEHAPVYRPMHDCPQCL